MRRSFSRLPATCLLLASLGVLLACGDSDASGSDADGADVVGDSAPDEEGPLDDAERMQVDVPSSPRGFRLGAGISVAAFGTETWERTLDFAASEAEWVVLHVDVPIPWSEVATTGATPPSFVDAVAVASDDIRRRGLEPVLLLDWLANDRRGLVRDADASSELPPLEDAIPYAERVAEALVDRIQPPVVVATYENNLWVAQEPDRFEDAVALHRAARRGAQRGRADALVVAVWDWETLRTSLAQDPTGQRALLARMDELSDVFGVRFAPAEAMRPLDELADDELALLDGRTTRSVAIFDTWWPASGFVRGDNVFASSENTQYNYVGWLTRLADRDELLGLAWAPVVDPGAWLTDPCATWPLPCDADRLVRKWQPRGPAGLRRSDGRARAAIGLWEATSARPLP